MTPTSCLVDGKGIGIDDCDGDTVKWMRIVVSDEE